MLKEYEKYGINVKKACEKLAEIPVSIHCWQGDDVIGFDHDGPLTGGIQTTGNYPGRATTPEELMADFDEVMNMKSPSMDLDEDFFGSEDFDSEEFDPEGFEITDGDPYAN